MKRENGARRGLSEERGENEKAKTQILGRRKGDRENEDRRGRREARLMMEE